MLLLTLAAQGGSQSFGSHPFCHFTIQRTRRFLWTSLRMPSTRRQTWDVREGEISTPVIGGEEGKKEGFYYVLPIFVERAYSLRDFFRRLSTLI